MTATPAQVANDMVARASFWRGRDKAVEDLCRESARVIRTFLAGGRPEANAVTELLARLCLVETDYMDTAVALARAASTITQLRKEARDAQA